MTTSLITNSVFTGVAANDGTGDNIRNAFNQINRNVANVTTFLTSTPTLTNVIVSDTLTALHGVFSNVQILSNTASVSSSTGALTIVNGVGIGGNLNVDGTISGTISSSMITAGALNTTGILTTYGDAVFAGNTTSVTGNLAVGGNTVINGSLVVHGNIISIATSEYIIEMPTIELGKVANASLGSNDGRDRGIEFFWYDTAAGAQKEGFFGFDNSSEKFTFIPRSSYVGSGDTDVFAGTPGTAVFGTVEANITSVGTSTFNNITATSGFTGNLLTTYQPNVTRLGTLSNLAVANGNVSVTNGSVDVTTGDVYVTGGTVKIWDGVSTYIPVALSTGLFGGGPVAGDTQFLSATSSTNPVTGAVKINGGLGVAGNVNVGGSFTTAAFSAITLDGTLTTAAQPNITSVGTLSSLAVTANISAATIGVNNISASGTIAASTLSASTGIAGTLTTPSQTNITSVGTLGSLSVTGNITGANFIGNFAGAMSGNISGSAATVRDAAQPAITSVGTLTSLSVTGAATTGSLNAGSGIIQTTGNITTTSSVVGTNLYGTVRTPAQATITSLGTLTSLVVSGNASLIGTTTISTGLAASSTLVTVGTSTNRFGTIFTTAVNSIGLTTTAGVSTSGNVAILTAGTGILYSDGSFQATATTAKASTLAQGGGTGTGMTFNWIGQAGQPSGLWGSNDGVNHYTYNPSNFNVNSATTATNITGTYAGSLTSLQITTGLGFTPITAAGAPVQSVGVTAPVTNSGTSSAPVINMAAATAVTNGYMTSTYASKLDGIAANATNVTNTNQLTNGAGFITSSGTAASITGQTNSATTTATPANTANTIVLRNASGNFSAGVITATSTNAQYADLAEMYQSDGQYDAGTVLVFGGRKEVTVTGHQADVAVAGVVSTAPAYLMNMDAVDAVAVALRGKVPVKLMGPVKKGDLLVTSYISGYAMSVGRDASYGVAIFAKSLEEDLAEGQKLINAVII